MSRGGGRWSLFDVREGRCGPAPVYRQIAGGRSGWASSVRRKAKPERQSLTKETAAACLSIIRVHTVPKLRSKR